MSKKKVYYRLESGFIIETSMDNDIWRSDPNAQPISEREAKAKRFENAKTYLLERLKPGDKIYIASFRYTSAGWHYLKVYIVLDGEILPITMYVAHLLRMQFINTEIRAYAVGDNIANSISCDLGHYLWPDGFACLGPGRCTASDHFNGEKNYSPHIVHKSGSSALSYTWL